MECAHEIGFGFTIACTLRNAHLRRGCVLVLESVRAVEFGARKRFVYVPCESLGLAVHFARLQMRRRQQQQSFRTKAQRLRRYVADEKERKRES